MLLRPVSDVDTGREIPGHVLIADLWVQPDPARASELARLGALGRMLERGSCLIEPFSRAPRLREIRGCILEQYSLDHHRAREAANQERPEPPFPVLWVISAGKPETLIESMALREMDGWPPGFWHGREIDAFHLVVARDLPRTPDTLFLRLLGQRGTFYRAVTELATRSEHAWIRPLLERVLVAFRHEIPQDQLEEDDMEALLDYEKIYAEWEREMKDEGERTALVGSIERLCAALQIELSAERRQQIESSDLEGLKQMLTLIGTTHHWPES